MKVPRAPGFHHKYLNLCSEDEFEWHEGESLLKLMNSFWLTNPLQFFSIALALFSNVYFFLETIISDLWTISFLFTSDWDFLLIWANCKCFGTCGQTVSTIVCSLHNKLHMACWSKLSRFSFKLSNSSQPLNHFSLCKPSHSKRSIQLSKIDVHACIFYKYLILTLFVMSAQLTKDL